MYWKNAYIIEISVKTDSAGFYEIVINKMNILCALSQKTVNSNLSFR